MKKATYLCFASLFFYTSCKRSHLSNKTPVWKPQPKYPPTGSPIRIFKPVNRTNFRYSWDDDNTFFDRIVMIRVDTVYKYEYQVDHVIAPGVFITERHVLTTYNPFRKFLKELYYYDVVVATLRERQGGGYARITHQRINCARQILPIREQDVLEDAWHGRKDVLRHNAVHDLLVAEVAGTMRFRNIQHEQTLPHLYNVVSNYYEKISHEFFDPHNESYYLTPDGPYIVDVARANEYMGPDLSFASIGFLDGGHIQNSYELRAHIFTRTINDTYDKYDYGTILDCDEWLLPDWGHFICIRDEDQFPGIGSGAMLFFNETLFGVGSFRLYQHNVSVMVFTDVRVYTEFIYGTCTDRDYKKRRKNFYDTRTSEFFVPVTHYNKTKGNNYFNEFEVYEWRKATYSVFSM